jgi:hypothetical protein
MTTAFLIFGLFFPRVTLLAYWLGESMPANSTPFASAGSWTAASRGRRRGRSSGGATSPRPSAMVPRPARGGSPSPRPSTRPNRPSRWPGPSPSRSPPASPCTPTPADGEQPDMLAIAATLHWYDEAVRALLMAVVAEYDREMR